MPDVGSSVILIGVMIYYLRKTEHLTTPRKVLSVDILALYGQEKILPTLLG